VAPTATGQLWLELDSPTPQRCKDRGARLDLGIRRIEALLVTASRLPAERQPSVDYTTLRSLARVLGRMFWRDLELHHPGISSLNLPAAVSAAWKERIRTREAPNGGQRLPRHDAVGHMATVQPFTCISVNGR
jgi:hypothetical protein